MTAVVTLGLALLLNMSITIRDQLPYLVLFSLAALLYLIRVNVFDEQSSWIRRRIGDPRDVANLYLKGGVTFVTDRGGRVPPPDRDGLVRAAGRRVDRHGPGPRQFRDAAPALSARRRARDADHGRRVRLERADHGPLGDRRDARPEHHRAGRRLPSLLLARRGLRRVRQHRLDVDQPATPSIEPAGPTIFAKTAEGVDLAPVTREVTFAINPLAYRGSTVFSPATPDRSTRRPG